MSTLWRKAVRDLQGERLRSLGIVVALALGIAGFFTVLSAYAILTRALNEGYRASSPASARLRVEHLDDEAVRMAASPAGVAEAEARRTVRGRIKTGPAQWRNLVLFARPRLEGSRIDTLTLEHGAWPSGEDTIALERDALQVAHAVVGDVVRVRTDAGTERSLRVTGAVHDVGQAQARMENLVYGYVEIDALTALGQQPLYDELAIRVAGDSLDETHIRDVAASVAATLEDGGRRVARVSVPEPGQHPHAKIMGLLMLSLAVFGFCILALSGVIVFNVLTALLSGQVRQIGVMKALGGTRAQIARVYLLEAGLLGVAAVITGVPIGIGGGRWLSRSMAVFLNFDINSFAVPLWVHALVFVAGLIVPVVAALIPVVLGTRIAVRDALTPNPTPKRPYGTSAVDRALARVSGANRMLLLAVRNASRNRLRSTLTLLTLATGGLFFMSAVNVRQSLVGTVDRFYAASRADLSVTLASDQPREELESLVRGVPRVSAVEAWTVLPAMLAGAGPQAGRRDISLVVLPRTSQMVAFDFLHGERRDDPLGIVVNSALYDRLGRPTLGAPVMLEVEGRSEAFRLFGVVSEPFVPATAYASYAWLEEPARTAVANSLRVALADADAGQVEHAKEEIERRLEANGMRIVMATTKAESRYSFDQHMLMIYVFLVIVSVILGGVGCMGLITTVSLNVTERRRELGVLRALGATPAHVTKLLVGECLVLGALSWLVASAVAVPLTKLVGDFVLRRVLASGAEIAVVLEPRGIFIWLAVALLGSILASLWPARQASRATVREALAHE